MTLEEELAKKAAEEEAAKKAAAEVAAKKSDDDVSDDDLDGDKKKPDDKGDGKTPEGQSKEERAKQARDRRERELKEREEQIRQEAYEKGKKDGALGASKKNEFTNEPIADEYDLKVYEVQKKIKESGGDPIADLPKELARIDRENASRKAAADKTKSDGDAKIDKDLKEAMSAYPEYGSAEKMKGLMSDPEFSDYADGKLGTKPLKEIIASFKAFKAKYGDKDAEKKRAEEEEAKRKASAPGSNGKPPKPKKPYAEMTKEEKIEELKRQHLVN